MTESDTTAVDPRYDPRFQRGYSGGADPDASGSTSTSAGGSTPPRSYPPRVQFSPPPQPFDATARLLEATERTAPSRLIRPLAVVASGAASDHAGDASSSLVVDAPEPEPEPGDGRERMWFIAGWVLSATLLSIGMSWLWAVNSDPDFYTGMGAADMAFRQLGWNLAPVFMQAGAVGLVLVTSFAAARQLDRSRSQPRTDGAGAVGHVRGFWRTPGVVALIVLVAASALIVIWLVRQVVEGSAPGFGLEPGDAEIMRVMLTQFASSAIGPFTLGALGAALAVILLGARDVRRAAGVADVSEPPER